MPLSVVKVGLDSKKQRQFRRALNLATGAVTIQVIEYWRVIWSGTQTDPAACYAATDGTNTIPSCGDAYTSGGGPIAWCSDVMPQLDPQSKDNSYVVQVTYQNIPPATTSGKWETQISIDGVPVTETYYYDLDLYQVTNSATQQFSQQPSRTYYEQAVEISFKTDSWDEADGEALEGNLNSAALTLSISALSYSKTFAIATLLFNKQSVSTTLQAGALAYWTVKLDCTYRPLVTAPTHCKTKGGTDLSSTSISTLEWDVIVDQGYQYLDSSSNKITNFQDAQGNNLNAPGLLDGTGKAVYPNGTAITSPGPNDAHYLAFRKAKRGDLTPLFSGIT